MKAITVLVLLLTAANMGAQSLADAPSSTVKGGTFLSAVPTPTVGSRPAARNPWDRLSLAIEAFKWAATVADIETTQAAVNSGMCREIDFLYGSRPSRLRLYGVMGGAEALHTYIGYRLRRSGHVKRLSNIAAAMAGAGHSFAAISNARCGKY
jgi:hypothetical protein